jgi:glycosyltransferase involved in cell wall biosynthesis
MNLPLVSIGVPFFNNEKSIERLIESLLNQNFENIEIILSDNCSTDNSKEKINKYLSNKKINYLRNDKNFGPIYNHNILLNYAKGKYFMWAHSDDFLSNNFIKDAVSILEKDDGVSSVSGKIIFMKNDVNIGNLHEPNNLNADGYKRIENYISGNFVDTLMNGLHRKSTVEKLKYIMSTEIPFTFNLLVKGKIEGCPSAKYFKYVDHQRSMKEIVKHYQYTNLFIGRRYAWYLSSILEILKSELSILDKTKLIIKFICFKFPLVRIFFRKKINTSYY